MTLSTYTIVFTFKMAGGAIELLLTAQVEKHPSEPFYLVKHFRTHYIQQDSVLPDVKIKKIDGVWVHCDSEKESELSAAIGPVIDEHEKAIG